MIHPIGTQARINSRIVDVLKEKTRDVERAYTFTKGVSLLITHQNYLCKLKNEYHRVPRTYSSLKCKE